MPTIDRISNNPYQWEIGSADLADVANVEKTMHLDFITADGFGITDKCRDYLYPLIQGEAYPDYDERGMPRYVVLKNELVDKKLGDFDL
jgi:6-phosphofructokinase 1